MSTPDLTDRTVLVIGGGGIAGRIADAASEAGATAILAGRRPGSLRPTHSEVRVDTVDLADEGSVAALAARVGPVDHLVVTASAPANGPVAALDRDAVHAAFDAKVIGPLLLLKHLEVRDSVLLFSGVAAWRPAAGLAVMATTNGAVSFLAGALAVELGPLRVNALSPGIVDSGQWDRLGDDRDGFFTDTAARIPARRIGTVDDVAAAALATLTNPFVTGTTLHVDGGGQLA